MMPMFSLRDGVTKGWRSVCFFLFPAKPRTKYGEHAAGRLPRVSSIVPVNAAMWCSSPSISLVLSRPTRRISTSVRRSVRTPTLSTRPRTGSPSLRRGYAL